MGFLVPPVSCIDLPFSSVGLEGGIRLENCRELRCMENVSIGASLAVLELRNV